MTKPILRWLLTLITIAGLAIDAYVHFDLASTYDPIASTTMSQGDLFRIEATIAIIVGVALLVRPRWYTAGLAAAVAGGGAIVVIIYRYVNVKAFGPIPAMYEPVWYTEKTLSVVAELVGAVAALALFATMVLSRSHSEASHPSPSPKPA